jgi:demethylmenaquinone methyltransferase/2-methoxy-6-polyprenyl-1,4-benzoquinol methylase
VLPGSKALDVCCGTADWTIALSRAVGPNGEVTGLTNGYIIECVIFKW